LTNTTQAYLKLTGVSYSGGCATYKDPIRWLNKPEKLNPGDTATWSVTYAPSVKSLCSESVVLLFQALDNNALSYDTCELTLTSGLDNAFPALGMTCLYKTLTLANIRNNNSANPSYPQYTANVVYVTQP